MGSWLQMRAYQLAKVVTATNVLAHVPDPHGFCEGVSRLLADDHIVEGQALEVGGLRGVGLGLRHRVVPSDVAASSPHPDHASVSNSGIHCFGNVAGCG